MTRLLRLKLEKLQFTICIKAPRLTADLTILPLRDCEVCVLIVREGSVEEYSLNGHAIIDFVVCAKCLRATGLNFNLEGQIGDLSNTSLIPVVCMKRARIGGHHLSKFYGKAGPSGTILIQTSPLGLIILHKSLKEAETAIEDTSARIALILSPIPLANQARKAVLKIILGEEGLVDLMKLNYGVLGLFCAHCLG